MQKCPKRKPKINESTADVKKKIICKHMKIHNSQAPFSWQFRISSIQIVLKPPFRKKDQSTCKKFYVMELVGTDEIVSAKIIERQLNLSTGVVKLYKFHFTYVKQLNHGNCGRMKARANLKGTPRLYNIDNFLH